MSGADDEVMRFSDVVLDPGRGLLKRAGKPISTRPKSFAMLVFFARNPNRVVSKDELIRAVWDANVVTDDNLAQTIKDVRRAIGDFEGKRLRAVPRRGYFFELESEFSSEPTKASAYSVPDKPSIAVLPFLNLSGDPQQEYFADGIVEEIITALSRTRWLFVIARNSSFAYKGRSVDVKTIGRELSVRYVLEGSVRKAGKRVRITGQLVDTSTGAHLWAERFESGLEDVFDLQDQVTASVVGTLAPKLEQAEIERAKRKPTESLDAYDYFLRGIAAFNSWTREATNEALSLFYKAIELDPHFAAAYGFAARCYGRRKFSGWVTDRAFEIAETARLVRQVEVFGREDAVALFGAGVALAFVVGDLDNGDALLERALVLNPNLAVAWMFSGWIKIWLGEPELAIEREARAMRLSPHDPQTYNMQSATAAAHFFAGRYGEALLWAEKAIRAQPDYPRSVSVAAASAALAGNPSAATRAMARLKQLMPDLRSSNIDDLFPIRRPEHASRWAEGLEKAGLPQ